MQNAVLEARAQTQDESLTDLKQHYATHLAKVDETNAVVANEDIVNDKGVLIIKKGSRVSGAVAEKVVKHKLLKPLHQQVDLNSLIDSDALKEHFEMLFKRFPDLKTVLESCNGLTELRAQISRTEIPRLIRQNITVLADQKTETYEKALFCTALSVMVASEMRLAPDEVEAAFLAGLAHDIGLLHIDPNILEKQGELEPAEWRAIKSHVLIGKMILAENTSVPKAAIRAVQEHHERCDGAGYPFAKIGNELGTVGQIIGICDALQAIRVNRFEKQGLNLANAVPFLQMNSETHFYSIYETLRMVIKKSGLAPTMPYQASQATDLLGQVISRSAKLFAAVEPVDNITGITDQENLLAERCYRKLHALSERISRIIHSSGILRMELVDWLNKLNSNELDAALVELHQLDLMQNELKWQLVQMVKMINEICDSSSGETINAIASCLKPIKQSCDLA